MPEFIALHSKLGVHNQKIIYETIPFACFLCLKAGHKAHQCPNEAKKKLTKPVIPDNTKKSTARPSGKGKMKMLWRCKLSVMQGRKAVSLKEATKKETLMKDPPMEIVSSSPLKLVPTLVNTILDPLVDPKEMASPLPIASRPAVEKDLLPEPIV